MSLHKDSQIRKQHQDNQTKSNALHKQHILALAERDTLCSTLKTMRTQLTTARRLCVHTTALRIAVRYLLDVGAAETLAAIAAIEPGLASEAFADGDRPHLETVNENCLTGERLGPDGALRTREGDVHHARAGAWKKLSAEDGRKPR